MDFQVLLVREDRLDWLPPDVIEGVLEVAVWVEPKCPKNEKARPTAAFRKKKVPGTIVSRTYLLFGRL